MVPELLVIGVPVVIIVPALVELAKGMGLPTRMAGLASILCSAVILGLVSLQSHQGLGGWATWLLASVVFGLASAGLFSQVKKLTDSQ